MKKNSITLFVMAVVICSPMLMGFASAQTVEVPFIYGTTNGPVDLDCHYMWDSASIDIADQVCEGLFAYDLTDPELKIVPRLASDNGVFSEDAKTFTVNLKSGVKFHDGTPFNATAVKWNFDRLMALIEAGESQIAELYKPLNGDLVINETKVISNTKVEFKLNYPYVPFKALLCFSGSYMMSPTSTPVDRLLEVGNDTLVGTGPYMYSSYVPDESITFNFFEDYYGKDPDIKTIIFQIFEDDIIMNQALLARDINMVASPLPDFFDEFEASENVTLSQGPARQIIQYIGMNNKAINQTYRQAISFAVNYSYVIDELMLGRVTRMKSPVPNGIMYANDTFAVPDMNITKARQILIDAGLAPGLAIDNDAAWVAKAEGSTPIASFNFTYNTGNTRRQALGTLIANNTKAIGIKVTNIGVEWSEYLTMLYGEFDRLNLYSIGWAPDYNDASNFINPLLSNSSGSNSAQVNDPQLQEWMMDAIVETNPVEREALYDKIQKRVVEELNPWLFLYVGKGFDAWDSRLTNYPQNAMGKVWFYDCEFEGNDIEIPGFETSLVVLSSLGAVALLIRKFRK